MLYALFNHVTNRFMSVEPKIRDESDWGYDGEDEKMVDYSVPELIVYDSQFQTVIFVTSDKGMAYQLKKKGKTLDADIKIAEGITLSDLEVIKLGKKSELGCTSNDGT